MLSYTQNTLNKLEKLLQILGFKIRYERGNFRSGTCLLQHENVLVVNRFSDMEMKVKAMIDVVRGLEIDKEIELDGKQRKLIRLIHQTSLDL